MTGTYSSGYILQQLSTALQQSPVPCRYDSYASSITCLLPTVSLVWSLVLHIDCAYASLWQALALSHLKHTADCTQQP